MSRFAEALALKIQVEEESQTTWRRECDGNPKAVTRDAPKDLVAASQQIVVP
jgi:hypothetical protein